MLPRKLGVRGRRLEGGYTNDLGSLRTLRMDERDVLSPPETLVLVSA